MEKLTILTDAAKYDAACTSSGLDRQARQGRMGSTLAAGCCHTFSADGRCVTLLKVLMTNVCAYDCQYCVNRRSNDVPRTTFTPRELADLTIQFYRRNYIEGLFLSSAVLVNPDYTTERMIEALRLLREEYHFGGYIHAKAIPGADPLLTQRLGMLADRLSVNIELPSEQSLALLAPDKKKTNILKPMAQIRDGITASKNEIVQFEGLKINFTSRIVEVDGKREDLSPKEYDLLFYLVSNKNIALKREQLITNIWGYDFYGDDRTLDTHIKLLRKSLGQYSKFIVTIRGVGYRFEA